VREAATGRQASDPEGPPEFVAGAETVLPANLCPLI
jgi:hypothetical protein